MDSRKGSANYNHLTTLSVEEARTLVPHDSELRLNGLSKLSPEVAEVLEGHGCDLYLDGLLTLSREAAAMLAPDHDSEEFACHRVLSLNGLTTLSAAAAEVFSQSHGSYDLFLDGLTTLLPDLAKPLSRLGGELHLNGVKELSPEAAGHLKAGFTGVYLDGLVSLPPEVARMLIRPRTFNDKEQYSDSFSEDRGYVLSLNGLSKISTQTAKWLANHRGDLHLDGLKELATVDAQLLALQQGELSLRGITKTELSYEAEKALSEHGCVWLGSQVR